MRDDLHRGAPVAKHWRSVISRCANDADWQTAGRRAYARAVARDANEELRNPVIRLLQERAASRQAPLPGTSPEAWLGTQLLPPEHHAARSVMRELIQGGADQGTVPRALHVALQEKAQAVERQVSAYVHSKDARNHSEFIRRLRSVRSPDVLEQAAQCRAQRQRVPVERARQRVDLDADLSA